MDLSTYRDHNGNSLAGTVDHLTEKLTQHGLTFVLVLVDKKNEDFHVVSDVATNNIPTALVTLAKQIHHGLVTDAEDKQ